MSKIRGSPGAGSFFFRKKKKFKKNRNLKIRLLQATKKFALCETLPWGLEKMPHLFCFFFGVFGSLWEAGTCLGWGSSGCSNGWNNPWGLIFFGGKKRFLKQRVWFLKRVVCWEWSSLFFWVKPSQVGGLVVMFRNFSLLIFWDRILKMPDVIRISSWVKNWPTCVFLRRLVVCGLW